MKPKTYVLLTCPFADYVRFKAPRKGSTPIGTQTRSICSHDQWRSRTIWQWNQLQDRYFHSVDGGFSFLISHVQCAWASLYFSSRFASRLSAGGPRWSSPQDRIYLCPRWPRDRNTWTPSVLLAEASGTISLGPVWSLIMGATIGGHGGSVERVAAEEWSESYPFFGAMSCLVDHCYYSLFGG